MTKTTAFINCFLFYFSVTVFVIFFGGGCETLVWYIPTICCGLIMWKFSKKYTEADWRVFTGVNFIQEKTGIDLMSDE